MSGWLHGLTGGFHPGQLGDVWSLAAALIAIRLLVARAVPSIDAMPAEARGRLILAVLAVILPGLAFLALAPSMIHIANPFTAGSPACTLHCFGLQAVTILVLGRAVVRCWWHARGIGRLIGLSEDPTDRVGRLAAALGIPVRQLPTNRLVLATAGIGKPRVLVSDGVLGRLTDAELRAALLHERAHLRRHETLRTALAAFLCDCSPVPVGAAFDAYCRAREHAADREAIREAHPLHLAGALVTLSRSELTSRHGVPLGERTGLRERIELLLNGPRTAPNGRHPAAAAGLLAAALVAGTLPVILRALASCGH